MDGLSGHTDYRALCLKQLRQPDRKTVLQKETIHVRKKLRIYLQFRVQHTYSLVQ